MADIVSYNDRESFRTPATNSGLQPNPPSTGLVLPKVHLGSFGSMDIDYFQSIGRSPIDPPRPQQPNEGDTRGANVDSFYGVTTPAMPTSDLMRQRSMSNEGRVWKPRTTSSPIPGTSGSPQLFQSQLNASPTSPPPVTQGPSALSQSDAQQPQARVDTSQAIQNASDRPPSDSPPSASPRSLSYLPPGAASPQHLRNSGMAGIGTVAWSPLPSSIPSRASPPQQNSLRQQSVRSSQHQTSSPDPQPPTELGYANNNVNENAESSTYGRRSPRVTQGEDTNDRLQGSYQQPSRSPVIESRMSIAQTPAQAPYPATAAPPRAAPAMQSSPYPSFAGQQPPASARQSTLTPPVDTRSGKPQTRGGPRAAPVVVEEVCIECMMRDRDMADVDVTGSGVWERESDVWYNELVRKEEEEEVRARVEGLPPPSQNPNGKQRPRAKGGFLTEENLKVWLTLVSSSISHL